MYLPGTRRSQKFSRENGLIKVPLVGAHGTYPTPKNPFIPFLPPAKQNKIAESIAKQHCSAKGKEGERGEERQRGGPQRHAGRPNVIPGGACSSSTNPRPIAGQSTTPSNEPNNNLILSSLLDFHRTLTGNIPTTNSQYLQHSGN